MLPIVSSFDSNIHLLLLHHHHYLTRRLHPRDRVHGAQYDEAGLAVGVPGDEKHVRVSLSQRGVKTEPCEQWSQDEAEQANRPTCFVERTPRAARLGLEPGVQLKPQQETEG